MKAKAQPQPMNRMSRRAAVRGQQSGFTLLEMLVVIGLAALIAGIAAYFFFESDGVKGQALYTEVAQVKKAQDRAKFDANCFPLLMEALVDKTKGTTSTCGVDVSSALKSPYLASANFDAASALKMPDVSTTSVMTVTSATASGKTDYFLSVSDVPDKIGQSFVTTCNRGATGTTPCAQGTVTGGKGPVTLLLQKG